MTFEHDAFDPEALVPGFHEPVLPQGEPDAATIAASETRTRHWTGTQAGRITFDSIPSRVRATAMSGPCTGSGFRRSAAGPSGTWIPSEFPR